MSNLRVVLHRTIPDDSMLQQQWNSLVDEMEHPDIFFTYQWALAVQRAYGDTLVPWLLLRYERTTLTGVAALATDRANQRVTFLAATTADYCDFLSHPSMRAGLLDRTFTELRKAGLQDMVFTNLPADSATVTALRSVAGNHDYRLFLRLAYLCPQVRLGSSGRDAMKAIIRKKKAYRYGMNVLATKGNVRVVHRESWETIEPALQEFMICHVARSLETGRVGNLTTARKLFLAELAKLLSEQGWMTLSEMRIGNRVGAWHYGFRFRDTWFWYQPTFNAAYERASPGLCLLSQIICEACDLLQIRVVDLGLGTEAYKERFATGYRRTLHGTITTSATRYVWAIVRYRAAQLLKLFPKLEKWLRGQIG